MREPLTENELRNMSGLPVYCPQINAYGIVRCDKVGKYANRPFLIGVQTYGDNMCNGNFEMDIIQRKLKCYLVGSHEKLIGDLDDEISFKIQAQDGTVYDNIEYFSSVDNCVYVKTNNESKKHLVGKYSCSARAAEIFMSCKQAKGLQKTYYLPEK